MLTLLPCGQRALLVEVAALDDVLRLTASIAASRASGGLPEVVDVTPAARTVLIACGSDPGAVDRTSRALRDLSLDDVPEQARSHLRLEVVYDGPDLDAVAAELGIEPDEVVRRHTARPWTVAFTGFSPGFGYLANGHPGLRVPRRAQPRTSVARGSVGLAGEFTCVYPRSSPGGWQLIGHTETDVFDPTRPEPALLRPGTVVSFVRATT